MSDILSDEIHDIIAKPPSWLLKWSMTIAFVAFLAVLSATWFVRYPDVVKVRVRLSADSPPRAIVFPKDGRLRQLLIKNEHRVQQGQIIGLLESTAEHNAVLRLASELRTISKSVSANQWSIVARIELSQRDSLGELQPNFQVFAKDHQVLSTSINDSLYSKRKKLLLREITILSSMKKNLDKQLDIQERDYKLAEDEYQMHERLYNQKAISLLEYKRENSKLVARELPLTSVRNSIGQIEASITESTRSILELENSLINIKNDYTQSIQTLISSIDEWKRNHLLVAPVDGTVSFSAPLQEQQYLRAQQKILTIEPDINSFTGHVNIPQDNFGKLKIGQPVVVKLDAFHYREFGSLIGTLIRISGTPGIDSVYWGDVGFKDKLKTTHGRYLKYKDGLTGTAEIVTKDRSLLERLVAIVPLQR